MHCGVDLEELDLEYDDEWEDQKKLRSTLSRHPLFAGKDLPPESDNNAWSVALNGFRAGRNVVVLAADLDRQIQGKTYSYHLKFRPLAMERAHRLDRRFGADRFFELVLPVARKKQHEEDLEELSRWLTGRDSKFHLAGRLWAPLFIKSDKKKQRKPIGPHGHPTTVKVPVQRVSFFATDGHQFRQRAFPTAEEAMNTQQRSILSYAGLLEWAIGLKSSAKQPVPKLFSRISLSTSKPLNRSLY